VRFAVTALLFVHLWCCPRTSVLSWTSSSVLPSFILTPALQVQPKPFSVF
jgi:hypothetical protein